jgi:hypothetical protein
MTELTFTEKLKRVYDKLDRLSHRKKSDFAYSEAREIANELKSLLPDSNNIKLDIKLLDDYSFKASDKRKSEVIAEFRKESMFDILPIVNRGKDASDPSIE